MLEQLKDLIQNFGQQAVVENQAVPNEQNEAVLQEAQQSLQDNIGQLAQSGQLQELAQHIQSGQDSAQHPAMQQIQNNFTSNLMQKFGLTNSAATGIASSLIPSVLQKFMGSGSNFNANEILSSLKGGNLQSTINNIGGKLGLDKDGDGDVDFGDIKKMF